jgi:FtsP/CotA-like multicopper oxidase with cupredoxin domain
MKKRTMVVFLCLITALGLISGGVNPGWAVTPMPNPGGVPDYFNTPNWANSPPLRKFVDNLPGLTSAATNSLGQYIPIANPDTTTYPGSDYYEIGLRDYTTVMHSDMPGGTKQRGYYQINDGTVGVTDHANKHLGPLIIAHKDRPVRVKFVNQLSPNAAGNLFIPVDTTVMGSGPFSIDYNPANKQPMPLVSGTFSQNRATLHLHGGRSPWISDGTPHQWIAPAGETTVYPKGVSTAYVPDMWFDAAGNTITACAGLTACAAAGATNNPGPGAETFFWSNQQSGRLMFYHDHAWGITRLNVYVGEAAGYLLRDPVEEALVSGGTVSGVAYVAGTIPAAEIPLVFEDKTFVSEATITATDPTWNWGSVTGSAVTGDLWWPHVYMPAQNPYNPNMSGINDMGRWHYGPWFFPPTPVCGSSPNAVPPLCIVYGPVANPLYDPACNPATAPNGFCQPPEMPGTPNPSWGAEAFLDTPVINGTAYPKVSLAPQQYRFRILNANHDRFVNLQMYLADTTVPAGCPTCASNTEVRMVPASSRALCTSPTGTNCVCDGTNAPAGCFPPSWPADGREGGVPDPAFRGPAFIQLGSEGGLLPQPAVLPNQPVTWNVDPTMFNVGNVLQQNEGGGTLFLGPAERADVIVDFTNFAGRTLILYNDAPTAFPALDPHYDYYTGAPDRTAIGGSPTTPVGFGPNVRTVMQINISGTGGTAPVDDYNAATLATLQSVFSGATGTGVFENSQSPIIAGQTAYNTTYNTTFPNTWPNWGISRISDTSINFMRPDGVLVTNYPMKPKAIHDEMGASFDDYGRMSAKLGLEVPFTNAATANFVLQAYVDPPTEFVNKDQVQIWKVTHNGVDTHPIHFHLFEVQVLNRVGWDGFIRLPDPNELGWKDTVRISPLEDTIVALRPVAASTPFRVPNSIRPLNPAFPLGSTEGFSQIDPLTGGPAPTPTTNKMFNFGWEYVWHCHILSHEENDMMRSVVLRGPYDNDFNGDLKPDILFQNSVSGDLLVWNMNGLNFSSYVFLSPQNPGFNWKAVATSDFNFDGYADVLYQNSGTGDLAVWFMNGTTMTSATNLVPQGTGSAALQVVAVADFNEDSFPDILFQDSATGNLTIWYMNGINRVSVAATTPQGPGGANWKVVGSGDFNGDTFTDLLFQDTTTGDVVLWNMNRAAMTSVAYLNPQNPGSASWKVVAVRDYNHDGTPDILFQNSVTEDLVVWSMNGSSMMSFAFVNPQNPGAPNWKVVR